MKVLFLNHTNRNCAVYQYGLRLFEILDKTNPILYNYMEIESLDNYIESLKKYPDTTAIIYNYHVSTMPWLNKENIQKNVKNIGILHECDKTIFDVICNMEPIETLVSEIYKNINYEKEKIEEKLEIKIPVSIGEIFDKLSILEIKRKKIFDIEKLKNVNREIEKLSPNINHLIERNKTLYNYLLFINEKIWDLMDQTKDTTLSSIDFANLSFQIYHENDARFRVKSLIDKENSSSISEVKSYKKETVIFLGFDKLDSKVRQIHETFLKLYFDIIIYEDSKMDIKEGYVYDLLNPKIEPKFSHLYNSKLIEKISENYNLETINYLHSGALGDLIHCLYVVKVNYLLYGKKGNIYLQNGFFTKNLNETYKDIKNVIEDQEYVNELNLFSNQKIDINLDGFRYSNFLYRSDWLTLLSNTFNIPLLNMSWLHCKKRFSNKYNNKIIINRSLNRQINNFPWEKIVSNNSCSYITYNLEDYNNFPFKEKVELIHVKSFEEIVDIIGNCKFFIGNQSAPLAIAYSFGIPCLGELIDGDGIHYIGLNNLLWISRNNHNLPEDILSSLTF